MPRRRLLLGVGFALGAGPALAQRPRAGLPLAQSLTHELTRALQRKQPLVVMVSLDGCKHCHQARQSHLVPMHKAGAFIVQVDMRSAQPMLDFAGELP